MHRRLALLVVIGIVVGNICGAREIEPLAGELVAVSKVVSGQTEQEAIEQACQQAVNTCVGRVYMGKTLVMARSLLDKYLQQHYKRFIMSKAVYQKRYEKKGQVILDINVYVNFDSLVKDLDEKRFLYKPRIRPFFYVFLEEVLEDQHAPYTIGSDTIFDILIEKTVRVSEEPIQNPPPNIDVSKDPELFQQAIMAAQKVGVGLFITGTSTTRLIKAQELYYDLYYFYETHMHLKLVRVDTGDILFETDATASSGHINRERAVELCIQRAANMATLKVIGAYLKTWKHMMLNVADYQLMFTGISPDQLDLVAKMLKALAPETEVYVKAYYNRIAVVNLIYKGERSELIQAIQRLPYPRLKIMIEKPTALEVQIET